MKNLKTAEVVFVCACCRQTKGAKQFESHQLRQGFIRSDTCNECSRDIEIRRRGSRRAIRQGKPTVAVTEACTLSVVGRVSANERLPLAA